MELGLFDKHFIKKHKKKIHAGKNLEFFLLHTLKTTFWKTMENLTQAKMDTIRAFSPNQGNCFNLGKGQGMRRGDWIASPSCSPVSCRQNQTNASVKYDTKIW